MRSLFSRGSTTDFTEGTDRAKAKKFSLVLSVFSVKSVVIFLPLHSFLEVSTNRPGRAIRVRGLERVVFLGGALDRFFCGPRGRGWVERFVG